MFRRVLVGATTALLTARMLAPGEDPGLLQNTSGPTNLLLPLLWLLAAIALAGWRLRSRQGDWRGGLVEAALLAAAVLAFASAETAGYRHPARLIAWEWLAYFIVVCLVRQLFLSPGDQQALLAVFLAGAASLSAQAVYQGAILRVPASATFAQPGPLAGWLALFLPGMLTAFVICRPGRAHSGLTILTALFAVLGTAAFVFAMVSAFGSADPRQSSLLDSWRAAGKMIVDRPLLGVGAGNYSRALPRFQDPGVLPEADPHNFLLETAATLGVLTLLAVLTALGAFLVRASRRLFLKGAREPRPYDKTAVGAGFPRPMETDAPHPEPASNPRVRWEYYIGAMCGLVLGFILRISAQDHTPNEVIAEGGLSCVRCLIWLTAFILFERVPWSERVRVGVVKSMRPSSPLTASATASAMPGASQQRARRRFDRPNAAARPATTAPMPYTPSQGARPARGASTWA